MKASRLNVGMVASLTGPFQGQGRQALEGVAAWVRKANEAGGVYVGSHDTRLTVQLNYYDDQSSPRVARELTEKLVLVDQVDLLLGPYSSVLTLAVAPVAERFHRVLWNHGGASDHIYDQGFRWVVGILAPASSYFIGVIDTVNDRDPSASKVAILHSANGSFPQAVASGAESRALQRGFQPAFVGRYRSPAELPSLIRQLEEMEPDIILGVGRIEDDLLLAKHILHGRTGAKAIALVAAGIGQFKEDLGGEATGFLGPSQWEPGAAYVPDYGPSAEELAKVLEVPGQMGGDYTMAQAYAAGLVAQRCVEEAGTLENGALRDVAGRLDFPTFYGRFKIDPETGRQVGRSVVTVQWQGGQKVVVWPRELRQGDLVYPSKIGDSC